MINKIFLFSTILVLTTGCQKKASNDVLDFQEIILNHFADDKIRSDFIPIKNDSKLTYKNLLYEIKCQRELIDCLESRPEKTLQTPSPMKNDKIEVGLMFYNGLFGADLFDEEHFNQIVTELAKNQTDFERINTKNGTDEDIEYIQKNNGLEKVNYREFSRPIRFGKYLMVYSNFYSMTPNLNSTGTGQFYVFEKKEETWMKKASIIKWIT